MSSYHLVPALYSFNFEIKKYFASISNRCLISFLTWNPSEKDLYHFDLITLYATLSLMPFSRKIHISVKVMERYIWLSCSIRKGVKIKIGYSKDFSSGSIYYPFWSRLSPKSSLVIYSLLVIYTSQSCHLWKQNKPVSFLDFIKV